MRREIPIRRAASSSEALLQPRGDQALDDLPECRGVRSTRVDRFQRFDRLAVQFGVRERLAAIPPLRFKLMNPKVLAWAGGDLTKLNRG